MKKTSWPVVGVIISLMLLAAGILVLAGGGDSIKWKSTWNHKINVTKGELDKESTTGDFIIDKTGTYVINIGWNLHDKKADGEEAGFMTVCKLTDDNGEVIYSTGGYSVDARVKLDMTKGNYHLYYSYFTENDAEIKDGERVMDYYLNSCEQKQLAPIDICAVFAVIIGSGLFLVSIIAYNRNLVVKRRRFDERQEIEQGRGYRYAFFTAFIGVGVTVMLDCMGVINDGMTTVFYVSAVIIGVCAYVIYGYWHDCYIALNEKRGQTILWITIAGALNLVLGISTYRTEGLINCAGKMNSSILNLIVGIAALFISLAGLVKSLTEKLSGEEDGRDIN